MGELPGVSVDELVLIWAQAACGNDDSLCRQLFLYGAV